jgi:hypothetical protein
VSPSENVTSELFGPLAALAGTWEGDEGLDVSFSNARASVIDTPYRERTTLSPFGPVENGIQSLYGLDYRTAAWRGDEENPFHTEVGYWLWDATDQQVLRSFMIPRGSTILAGGSASPDDTTFTMVAAVGSETYGILSNQFLAAQARCISYEVTVTVAEDGSWSYDETSTIEHQRHDNLVIHTDRNVMRRVD